MTHAKPDDAQPPPRPAADDNSAQVRTPSKPGSAGLRLAIAVPVAISIVALGIAIWALLRPPPDASMDPTDQQVAEARDAACAAYARVRTSVALQSQTVAGTDPNVAPLVATNARLAMAVGSQHIVDNLGPAVPAELADDLRSVATGLQDLTMDALAGTDGGGADQVERLRELEATSQKIVELCT